MSLLKQGQLFWEKKVHPRENPGYACEKRAPTLRWYGAPEWLTPPEFASITTKSTDEYQVLGASSVNCITRISGDINCKCGLTEDSRLHKLWTRISHENLWTDTNSELHDPHISGLLYCRDCVTVIIDDSHLCLVVGTPCPLPASQCSHESSCPHMRAPCRRWHRHTGPHPAP